MKIIHRSKEKGYEFITQKSFNWDGRVVQKGEEIVIKEQADQDGMVQRRQVRPSDLVDGAIYVAVRPFTLPGQVKKFETKAMELVSLKASDALALMLDRAVIPRDPDQWRPYKMKLGAPKIDHRFKASLDEAERASGVKALAKELAKGRK
jgi:hypothetical protein